MLGAMESRRSLKLKDKSALTDLECQMKEIKTQFGDQLRCFENRTELEASLIGDIQDYYRRRADVEAEYGRSLEKLWKQLAPRFKADKQRQDVSQFSLYGFWKQLISDTKVQAHNRTCLSNVYSSVAANKYSGYSEALLRVFKQLKQTGEESQREIVRVLTELHTAFKTYQLCHAACTQAEIKFKTVELQKAKFEEAHPKKVGSRKHRFLEREYDKKQEKYCEFQLKSLKARNEYLLCIDAANTALHKYFAEDVPDFLDGLDASAGSLQWLRDAISAAVEAEHCVNDAQKGASVLATDWLTGLDLRRDKAKFLENNHSMFILPKKFEFCAHAGDNIAQISAEKMVQEDLVQRFNQLSHRLIHLRTETDEIWKTLETAEKAITDAIHSSPLKVSESFKNIESMQGGANASDFGAVGGRQASFRQQPEPKTDIQKRKQDLEEIEHFYLQKFREYLLTCNLIDRLQARHDAISTAIGASNSSLDSTKQSSVQNICAADEVPARLEGIDKFAAFCSKARKKRIGRNIAPKNPQLFGGSLEEYVEATREDIPLIIRSCVRYLGLHGLHHQGIFRVSGSQIEINTLKEAFEKGEDPLADITETGDANSVAGVLKLYFREAKLLPLYMFDQFIDCGKYDKEDFINRVRALVRSLSRPVFIVLRYLFAFLNHLSEFSDENMMDEYNLAICFGPTLLPIPESRDQVEFHNSVNNLVKNLIVYQDSIFPNDGGTIYEKYLVEEHPTDVDKVDDVLSDDEDAAVLSHSEGTALNGRRGSLPAATANVDENLAKPSLELSSELSVHAPDVMQSSVYTCSSLEQEDDNDDGPERGRLSVDSSPLFCLTSTPAPIFKEERRASLSAAASTKQLSTLPLASAASVSAAAGEPSAREGLSCPVWIKRIDQLDQLAKSLKSCTNASAIECFPVPMTAANNNANSTSESVLLQPPVRHSSFPESDFKATTKSSVLHSSSQPANRFAPSISSIVRSEMKSSDFAAGKSAVPRSTEAFVLNTSRNYMQSAASYPQQTSPQTQLSCQSDSCSTDNNDTLGELQSELKAVLRSLEGFSDNSSHESKSYLRDYSSTLSERNVSPLSAQQPSIPNAQFPFMTSFALTGATKDAPDLVQNLPKRSLVLRSTMPASSEERHRSLAADFSNSCSVRDSALSDGTIGFASNDGGTLKQSPAQKIASSSTCAVVSDSGGVSVNDNNDEVVKRAAVDATAVSQRRSSGPYENQSASTGNSAGFEKRLSQALNAGERVKPPIAKKPYCEFTGPKSWLTTEPVEILKM